MTTATPPIATTAPLTLWLTDRSRWKLGTSRCARARYLGYHSGPTGYGITAKRESLPLVTGISVHRGLEAFTHILRHHDRLPDAAETRGIIADITGDYLRRVEQRGYRGMLDSTQTRDTVHEQCALVAGLLWVLRLKFLPWLHASYRVVRVEEERLHMLSDDQAIMIRTDLLAQRRGGQSLAYFECKTTGWASDAWAEQWETDAQLALGTVDAQELWGAEVTELYIVGLNKGRRQRDKYDPDERKKQLSPLCYGYCRPANPPFQAEDWLPSYEWIDQNGETKRASRAHKRKGVWLLDQSDWPTWLAYKGNDSELTGPEFWVRAHLPESVREQVCFILGPMNRQDQQLQGLLRGFQGEETRWQHALWALYSLQQQGYGWGSPQFHAELDRLIPCSWACRPFGKEHQCEFVGLCHHHAGWEDPIGGGHYQARLPHHDPELQQAVARGLLPEQAETVDDDE